MRNLSELNVNEGASPVGRAAPSKKILDEFQSRYRITLPGSYIDLLKHSNGGHPELDMIVPIGIPGAGPWAVDHFYHLGDDKTSAESLWQAMEVWRPILGDSTLVFAEDGFGNQFFLDLNEEPAPVRVCVHDEGFRVIDMAPTFDAFVDALSISSDVE